jgi:hypothetical protein
MTRLSLALCVALPLAWAGAARADLHCEGPLFQAGQVRSGAPLAHRFTLSNAGPEEVEVTEIKPGCGCLRPRLEGPALLRPGEARSVLMEVNTLAQPEGPNTWRAVVGYRCASRPRELPLFVTADVVSEVSVRPAGLLISTDTAIGHEVTLIDRRPTPLAIQAVTTSSRHFRPRAGAPRRAAGGHWEWALSLEVAPDCPEGRHEEVLLVHTSDPAYAELKVPFTVVKRPRQKVSAVPGVVSLLAAGDAPLPARIVLLGAADEEEVVIDRVEADSPAIQCRWAPGPGPRATLKVQVERARLTGPYWEGKVHVHLSRPVPQTITVPVRCTLR